MDIKLPEITAEVTADGVKALELHADPQLVIKALLNKMYRSTHTLADELDANKGNKRKTACMLNISPGTVLRIVREGLAEHTPVVSIDGKLHACPPAIQATPDYNWTREQVEKFPEWAGVHGAAVIATMTGASPWQVRKYAAANGIRLGARGGLPAAIPREDYPLILELRKDLTLAQLAEKWGCSIGTMCRTISIAKEVTTV